MTDEREVDMRRPPVDHAIWPRIRARCDGAKFVGSVPISDCSPTPAKIWIKRSLIPFLFVTIPAARVCLPNFNQTIWNWASVLVNDTAPYNDARAKSHFSGLGEIENKIVI